MTTVMIPRGQEVRQEFEQLFREHYKFVYSTAYSVTGTRQDAEDVLQTIFLRLLRREDPPALKQNPKGYLYRAAVNESLSIIRGRKRQDATDVLKLLETEAAPAEPDADNELQRKVREAMAQLSPLAVEVLILHYEHDYSDAKIAKLLGRSRGTIAVTLYRTRARLKRLLKARLGDPL
jgi:RNA polymerase sigma-70 factor (ECF subfamily)